MKWRDLEHRNGAWRDIEDMINDGFEGSLNNWLHWKLLNDLWKSTGFTVHRVSVRVGVSLPANLQVFWNEVEGPGQYKWRMERHGGHDK